MDEFTVVQVQVRFKAQGAKWQVEAVYAVPKTADDLRSMADHLWRRFQQEVEPGFSALDLSDIKFTLTAHTLKGMAAARMQNILKKQCSGELPMWLMDGETETRYRTRKEV